MTAYEKRSSRGFTLVELMVYMVVASIAVIIAARFFLDVTIMSADSKKRVKLGDEAQNIMLFLEEDLSRMGNKLDGVPVAGSSMGVSSSAMDIEGSILPFAYMGYSSTAASPGEEDSSSFRVVDDADASDGERDRVTFRTITYDLTTGFADSLEEVTYSVDASNRLVRTLTKYPLNATRTGLEAAVSDHPDAVTYLADSVVTFKLQYGEYATNPTLDTMLWVNRATSTGTNALTVSNGNVLSVDLEGFTSRGVPAVPSDPMAAQTLSRVFLAEQGVTGWRDSVISGRSYNVSLFYKTDSAFLGYYNFGYDTMYVGVRKLVGTDYLPIAGTDSIYRLFPTPANNGVYFDFSFSPSETVAAADMRLMMFFNLATDLTVGGTMVPTFRLDTALVQQENSGQYNRHDNPDVGQRERTGSVDVTLQLRKGITNGDAVTLTYKKIIPVPNNGPR